MGKKGRRTRWRTLTITDEHSDSEESNTTSGGHRVPKGYPQKNYYSRFTYSSQSTPTRRYQCDGAKSTRSSSTASENKITFNEDEYTRITTPRQDVLFKKGYLNKPKSYQTQNSTGNSTNSTGNSTGNGTPDHQSTDLEYESQFVFPNGFVDQNGIYYVNSFEPYHPVMVYNPPTYYPEYSNVKAKRSSTGSLTESTSPNNEETSQDLSQSETPNNDLSQVYNVIYPAYYYNGVCQTADVVCEPEPRKVKKRRRRKVSRSKEEGTTSESSDEIFSDEETPKEAVKVEDETKNVEEEKVAVEDTIAVPEKKLEEAHKNEENAQQEEYEEKPKYDLKPDAEEFVPRAYRTSDSTIPPPNVQFVKIPSNFVPVPIINPIGEFNAFIPHGIPINFIQPNYVNFVPYQKYHQQPLQPINQNHEEQNETEETTLEVPKNQIDIARIVSKLEEAAKEQEENEECKTNVKEEAQIKNRKKQKYQKVDDKKPPSPKINEETKLVRNYSETLKKSKAPSNERQEKPTNLKTNHKSPMKETPIKNQQQKIDKPQTKVSNEWISVSRKKRKNKNFEENEDFDEKTEEIIVEITETKPIEIPQTPIIEEETIPVLKPEPQQSEETETKIEEKKKKKPKKKTTPPKRVIITDLDLSVPEVKKVDDEIKTVDEVKTVEEEVKIIEEKKIDEELEIKISDEKNEIEEEIEVKTAENEEEKKEIVEKKSKKKKKKKVASILSDSITNANVNASDDVSYSFLLDESLDKTNVEISQELDKMIQRGMYNNLEEKIKSMNIETSENFFKTIISNISSRESSVEKSHSIIKTTNFNRLLPSSNLRLSQTNDFLCDGTTSEGPIGGGDANDDSDLYPITRAVKEWMVKRRETTPDVEILKSPSMIFREFTESRQTSEEPEINLPKHGNLPYRAICCSIM